MNVGNRDALTASDAPFVLLAGRTSPSDIEAALRHMGLQPEVVEADGDQARWFRLRFGALSVQMARAGINATDLADPRDRATSLLGATLAGHWREACWYFCPEIDGGGPPPSEFFGMMVLLIDLFGAEHFFWSPARLWSDAAAFRQAIAEMQASGMPPVLHLIAFRRHDDGGRDGAIVTTRGLATFAGQELEAPIPAGWDMAAMVRRLARLALDVMLHGPVSRTQQAPGLAAGEWVAMTPRPGGDGRPDAVRVEFSRDG